MASSFRYPKTQEEVEKFEVAGLWKAQSFAKGLAEDVSKKISLKAILEIHKVFFDGANPSVAGRFRANGEDIKKLNHIEPPPGRVISDRMHTFWIDFDQRLSKITKHPKANSKRQREQWLDSVLSLSAWTQHQITAIHPFCEGNGRMARIMSNVVLRRFGLPESSIHHEGVSKEKYLNALQAIDDAQNYEPLKDLIGKSMRDTLRKVYAAQKKLKQK